MVCVAWFPAAGGEIVAVNARRGAIFVLRMIMAAFFVLVIVSVAVSAAAPENTTPREDFALGAIEIVLSLWIGFLYARYKREPRTPACSFILRSSHHGAIGYFIASYIVGLEFLFRDLFTHHFDGWSLLWTAIMPIALPLLAMLALPDVLYDPHQRLVNFAIFVSFFVVWVVAGLLLDRYHQRRS